MTEPDDSAVAMFMNILKMERDMAAILVANEITTIEEVAYVPMDELLGIEGLDKAQIPAYRQRAREHLLREPKW